VSVESAHPNLSFEQAPPIDVPFRFFLTAPWFGVAAGFLLSWTGELAVLSRWTPEALALTHLLVVGLMLQAMTGALFQFVPVAAGGNVWRPRQVAAILHPLLLLAAMLLVAGFLRDSGALLRWAAVLFLLGVSFQVAVVGTALCCTPARAATVAALRLAIGGLAVTVALGAALAEGLAGGHGWPLTTLANIHAGWGLGGWALMLVAGVSYFVVPMFQLTPPYPARLARALPIALLAALTAWSAQIAGMGSAWVTSIWLVGLGLAAGYAVLTLWLQQHRRRRIADPTFLFFRGAMLCLLATWISAAIMTAFPVIGDDSRSAWWLGVLILAGAFVSVINGMLYKIVPFLCWLHLQRLAGVGGIVPNMREMISERAQRRQMRLHFVSLAMLLLATFWPSFAGTAGVLFSASSAWLGLNLIGAVRAYRRFTNRTTEAGADPAR
jgi:predicted outer membrane lipoprotein